MKSFFKQLGPGLLFAGAAIGVSHLVQSTRAGADFGWGLLWILVAAHGLKYPFFQLGTRYALATNQSLIEGYHSMGKKYLWIYFFLTLGTMFTIQTAVTIVTASLATMFTGTMVSLTAWSTIITLLCLLILWRGSYGVLDRLMKWIISILTLSTVVAVFLAGTKAPGPVSFEQILPPKSSWVFIAALVGWMPAPLDLSIWQSLWTLEKRKAGKTSSKEGLFDFNLGYAVTFFLGLCFMGLGAYVMHHSGNQFSAVGSVFAQQLIHLYTNTLGEGIAVFVSVAALTTMLSTTLTTLDASPRALERSATHLFPQQPFLNHRFWLILLSAGTIAIFTFFRQDMGTLVKIATVLSFVTAPFYAIMNYRLLQNDNIAEEYRMGKGFRVLALLGIVFLVVFAIAFLLVEG